TTEAAGFMSPGDKEKLDSLGNVDPLVKSVENSATIAHIVDESGKLTSSVKTGSGMKVSGAVNQVEIVSGGENFVEDDEITLVGGNGDAVLKVLTVDDDGA